MPGWKQHIVADKVPKSNKYTKDNTPFFNKKIGVSKKWGKYEQFEMKLEGAVLNDKD